MNGTHKETKVTAEKPNEPCKKCTDSEKQAPERALPDLGELQDYFRNVQKYPYKPDSTGFDYNTGFNPTHFRNINSKWKI